MAREPKSRKGAVDRTAMQNAVKTLAANIRFSSVDKPIRSIAVVSSIPSEGKTTISVALGQAIADGGSSVLLVECDMRRRSLATALGVHGRHGLHSLLSGRHTAQECVVATPTRNLYFLDAEPGIPNPPDVLQSHRFADAIKGLQKSFDCVILDTPPVTAFVDASIVASVVDATVLVVRQDFVHRDEVRDAYQQLQQAGANVIGTVLNCAESPSTGRYYGYYDYYHEKDESEYDAVREPQKPAPQAPTPQKAAPAAKADSTSQFLQQAGYKPQHHRA